MREVTLPTGDRVPALGLGTWKMGEAPRQQAAEVAAVRLALEMGYRLIDTAELLTMEERLADWPAAQQGLHRVLDRAHRAARFALGFAVQRVDRDAMVIREAALLHDLAEMLLWCHAPALALEIAARQQSDPALRSEAAQCAVLGVALADVQTALMKAWSLPEVLLELADDRRAETGQVRNVLLAVRLARHTAQGWDNPALPDDVADIAQLLRLSPDATLALLHEIND